MSDLQNIYNQYKDQGVVVYGLNVPAFGENAQTLANFTEQAGLTYPVLNHNGTSYLIEFGGSNGFPYPRDAIIDQTGRIVHTSKSYDAQQTRQIVMGLLANPPTASP